MKELMRGTHRGVIWPALIPALPETTGLMRPNEVRQPPVPAIGGILLNVGTAFSSARISLRIQITLRSALAGGRPAFGAVQVGWSSSLPTIAWSLASAATW